MITGKNYIGNKLSSDGTVTYQTTDPKQNTKNKAVFYEASKEEVNEAVEKASKAFDSYKAKSDAERANFLNEIATEIENMGTDLTDMYMKESGLPEGRAKGECARTTGQLRAFAKMLQDGSWVEAIINNPDGKPDLRRMLLPIGPVVVFGASNFPFAFSTAGGDTASALAAGSPVIVKSHPLHSGTGEMVSSAIIAAAEKTGMPDGVFSNLNSSGIEVGQWLVQHPKVSAVGFTGSIKAGTALYKLATQRDVPIPVYAEMGSINPVVILPSALEQKADTWAENYAGSITAGAGQFCTNPGLILGIKGKALDGFIKKLGENLEKAAPSCMLHPNIKEQYDTGWNDMLSQNNIEEITKTDKPDAANAGQHHLVAVEGSHFLKNRNLHKEVFGPFSLVVRCADKDELTKVINNLEGQLTGTILNADENELKDFSKTVEALQSRVGRLIYNSVPTGVEVCGAMTHGGPFPATTDSKFTSVGLTAVKRWVRPVSFQDWPNTLLPDALKDENPLRIFRTINDKVTQEAM